MVNSVQFAKKQHYIPQFYLKNFSHDNSHVYVYDKRIGEKGQIRYQTTTEVAHENHFYTYRTKMGTKENLEDFFGNFESIASTIIDKVYREKNMTLNEKEYLSMFVALMYTRTPAFKERTESMHTKMGEKVSRMMIKMTPKETLRKFYKEKLGKTLTDEELADIVDFGTNPKRSRIGFTYPREFWIKTMLELSAKIAPYFFGMSWVFLYTDKPYAFISSDNPFLLAPPDVINRFYGVGLLTQGARKIIPLRSNLCLVMGDICERPSIRFARVD
jgi:hypothetical protein